MLYRQTRLFLYFARLWENGGILSDFTTLAQIRLPSRGLDLSPYSGEADLSPESRENELHRKPRFPYIDPSRALERVMPWSPDARWVHVVLRRDIYTLCGETDLPDPSKLS